MSWLSEKYIKCMIICCLIKNRIMLVKSILNVYYKIIEYYPILYNKCIRINYSNNK